MKKILIVLDIHPSAKKIIETGYAMAKDMKATVVLLYVKIDLMNYTLMYKKVGVLKPFNLENFEVAAIDFLKNSKQNVLDDMIQTVVKQGNFAKSILNAAKEMKIDIIVMGSHNASWLEEIVIGRVTNDNLQQSEIPILIIPTRTNYTVNTIISLEN